MQRIANGCSFIQTIGNICSLSQLLMTGNIKLPFFQGDDTSQCHKSICINELRKVLILDKTFCVLYRNNLCIDISVTEFFKFYYLLFPGCSQAYNMNNYPGMRNLNSQVAEQRNSQIKPLSSMLSYMTRENFMLMLKIHMIFRNYLHMARSCPGKRFQYKDFIVNLMHAYCK